MAKYANSPVFGWRRIHSRMCCFLETSARLWRYRLGLTCALFAAFVSIAARVDAKAEDYVQGELLTCLNSEEFREFEETRLNACIEHVIESCFRLENSEDVDACLTANTSKLREFNGAMLSDLANGDPGNPQSVAEAQFLRTTNRRTCIDKIPNSAFHACMLAVEFGFTGRLVYISQNLETE